MGNRLAAETSPYLLQHADNPVDWHAWGTEAFEQALKADKPMLLSIGYAACHWCHVMAHESFEDPRLAELMNREFINVKIDREERPDLDKIYMEAVQMLNGQGGWPLNVFCLPDGRPFAGGTYFPPTDRGQGLIPWPQLLVRISNYYHREKEKLEENAQAILENAGLDFGNVVKTTVFLTNIKDFQAMNAVYATFFEGTIPPARSTVAVASLPAGATGERDVIAVR